MRYYVESNLDDFGFWSGAKQTAETLRDLERMTNINAFDILEDMLTESEPTSGYSETDINDFFWFEDDIIADWLGFEDWEALERAANGEEEEEEEED